MNHFPVLAALLLLLAGPIACNRPSAPPPSATPTPGPSPSPEQAAVTPEPTPTPQASNASARVIVLCYHRFENPARDSLALTPEDFRSQMQALKDAGIEVISMQDLLAWRRGEKTIPEKAAVITIDDGYVSGYTEAWPILKEYGYPFTMFIYTDYVGAGGRSISWEQLAEMRDAGVEIHSHSVSHDNMVRPKRAKGENYDEWLANELKTSKEILERELGISTTVFAYPFGIHNDRVEEEGLAAGYEALFTVYGQKLRQDSPAAELGRYAIDSRKPEVFQAAIKFTGGAAAVHSTAPLAASAMLTQPAERETISDPLPEIMANLASLGNVDPKSVEVRLSGFGIIPSTYDPESKLVKAKMRRRLREKEYTVIVSAKAGGKKVEARWNFFFDPKAASSPSGVGAPPQA